MEEKPRFVFDYERDEHSMVELCSRYGICRESEKNPIMRD